MWVDGSQVQWCGSCPRPQCPKEGSSCWLISSASTDSTGVRYGVPTPGNWPVWQLQHTPRARPTHTVRKTYLAGAFTCKAHYTQLFLVYRGTAKAQVALASLTDGATPSVPWYNVITPSLRHV